MNVFCHKKLEAPVPLFERLSRARIEKKIGLDSLSARTHIQKKYLIAIENGSFTELPEANVYGRSYVRAFAKEVGLDVESVLYQFNQIVNDGEKVQNGSERNKSPLSPLAKPRQFLPIFLLLRNAFAVVFVAAFAFYLIWQVRGILEPPKLSVYTPMDGFVTSQLNVLVQGETEKECLLTINGQEVRINERGHFEFPLDLSNGLNTIIISATKKHGKTTTLTRRIVAKWVEAEKEKVSVK